MSHPPPLPNTIIIFYIERINARVVGRGSVAGGQNNPYKKRWPSTETVIIIKIGKSSSTPPQHNNDILY